MNVYKVSRTDAIDWDNYIAFVCIAATEEDARNIHPYEHDPWPFETWDSGNPRNTGWVHSKDINTLTVEYIGTAAEPARIILASYCAG
jgi:hypothetical protein